MVHKHFGRICAQLLILYLILNGPTVASKAQGQDLDEEIENSDILAEDLEDQQQESKPIIISKKILDHLKENLEPKTCQKVVTFLNTQLSVEKVKTDKAGKNKPSFTKLDCSNALDVWSNDFVSFLNSNDDVEDSDYPRYAKDLLARALRQAGHRAKQAGKWISKIPDSEVFTSSSTVQLPPSKKSSVGLENNSLVEEENVETGSSKHDVERGQDDEKELDVKQADEESGNKYNTLTADENEEPKSENIDVDSQDLSLEDKNAFSEEPIDKLQPSESTTKPEDESIVKKLWEILVSDNDEAESNPDTVSQAKDSEIPKGTNGEVVKDDDDLKPNSEEREISKETPEKEEDNNSDSNSNSKVPERSDEAAEEDEGKAEVFNPISNAPANFQEVTEETAVKTHDDDLNSASEDADEAIKDNAVINDQQVKPKSKEEITIEQNPPAENEQEKNAEAPSVVEEDLTKNTQNDPASKKKVCKKGLIKRNQLPKVQNKIQDKRSLFYIVGYSIIAVLIFILVIYTVALCYKICANRRRRRQPARYSHDDNNERGDLVDLSPSCDSVENRYASTSGVVNNRKDTYVIDENRNPSLVKPPVKRRHFELTKIADDSTPTKLLGANSAGFNVEEFETQANYLARTKL